VRGCERARARVREMSVTACVRERDEGVSV